MLFLRDLILLFVCLDTRILNYWGKNQPNLSSVNRNIHDLTHETDTFMKKYTENLLVCSS